MISTSIFGRHSGVCTQTRTAGFCRSTHWFQTTLCSSKSCISASQPWWSRVSTCLCRLSLAPHPCSQAPSWSVLSRRQLARPSRRKYRRLRCAPRRSGQITNEAEIAQWLQHNPNGHPDGHNKKARCHCAGPVRGRALSCRMTSCQSNSDQDMLSPCGRQSARQVLFTTPNTRFQ